MALIGRIRRASPEALGAAAGPQRHATNEIEPAELSAEQGRTLARIRAFQPHAEVHLHGKPGGVLVELRRGHQAQVAFIDESGAFVPDRSLRPAC